MTLNFLGNGSYQKSISSHMYNSMSQSSSSRFIAIVCDLMVRKLLPIWVTFPTTQEGMRLIKEGFFLKWGMAGVIGAVDGTHVKIVAPASTDENHPPHLYIDRKGNHSINVMLVDITTIGRPYIYL